MLFHKITDLIAETVCQRFRRHSKERIGRPLVSNAQEPFLYTAKGIFKAEVESCAFGGGEIPERFSFCYPHTEIQHQPGLTDLGSTTEDTHAVGQ